MGGCMKGGIPMENQTPRTQEPGDIDDLIFSGEDWQESTR